MTATLLDPPQVETQPGRRSRRLLLVAYNFPPVGGAGVQRPVKWVKYLGRYGWDVTVLTTSNPSVPVRDESLLADLPADVTVVRARTWEPDYSVKKNLIRTGSDSQTGFLHATKTAIRGFAKRCIKLALQPDPQVLWNFHAIKAGSRVLREQQHDAILVTAPAFSSFYIGAALKRRFGLPLVLDYRDEWDLSGKYLENAQQDWLSRTIQTRMQDRLLRCSDAVIATTRRSTETLARKLERLRHSVPASCIYNGYDAGDFDTHSNQIPSNACDAMLPDRGTFRLVYTGTLWNLTDIQPLIRGIETLDVTDPALTRRLELVCVGRKTAEQKAILHRLGKTSVRLVDIDYCDHATALQWLRSASGLCLLLTDVPGAERVVPAKLFEYLATSKDMLAICPTGEAAEIVGRFFPGGHFTPQQIQPIAKWLQQRLDGSFTDRYAPEGESAFHEFSRESQTARLAELLNSLVVQR